jgi:hypothetical protein
MRAVKGSIDDAKLGNLTGLLAKIRPAVSASGPGSSKDDAYVTKVAQANVSQAMKEIREKSPTIKAQLDAGTVGLASFALANSFPFACAAAADASGFGPVQVCTGFEPAAYSCAAPVRPAPERSAFPKTRPVGITETIAIRLGPERALASRRACLS